MAHGLPNAPLSPAPTLHINVSPPSYHSRTHSGASNHSQRSRFSSDSQRQHSLSLQQSAGPPPIGYPGLSKFLNSETDLLVFRRYGQLGVRNILYKQDIVAELEEKLKERDDASQFSDTRRFDEDDDRKELMEKLHNALKDYEEALRIHDNLLEHSQATQRQINNLKAWFKDWNPVVSEESTYYDNEKEELLSLAGKKSSLHRFVDSHRALIKVFSINKPPPDGVHYEGVSYYSLKSVEIAYRAAVVFLSWIFLVLPICLLFFADTGLKKLIIVVIFLVTFSILIAVGTKAKSWEMLAANAAYAATLLVFFQIDRTANGDAVS